MGFSDKEIVALLCGGHAYGRCHKGYSGYEGIWIATPTEFSNEYAADMLEDEWVCVTHDTLIDGQPVDERVRPAEGKRQYVSKNAGTHAKSDAVPQMMLVSDMVLLWDAEFKTHLQVYADSLPALREDFGHAYKKLTENVNPKTFTVGGCPFAHATLKADSMSPAATTLDTLNESETENPEGVKFWKGMSVDPDVIARAQEKARQQRAASLARAGHDDVVAGSPDNAAFWQDINSSTELIAKAQEVVRERRHRHSMLLDQLAAVEPMTEGGPEGLGFWQGINSDAEMILRAQQLVRAHRASTVGGENEAKEEHETELGYGEEDRLVKESPDSAAFWSEMNSEEMIKRAQAKNRQKKDVDMLSLAPEKIINDSPDGTSFWKVCAVCYQQRVIPQGTHIHHAQGVHRARLGGHTRHSTRTSHCTHTHYTLEHTAHTPLPRN
jgi:macrodomain Ter protein organizer (MatP/YcbG family)